MAETDATAVSAPEAAPDVRHWQAEKIRAGLREADEGRFASSQEVRSVIQKFVPNG